MKAIKKIVLGLGIASGAVLAAYLITGDRGHRTRSYIVQSERHTGRFQIRNEGSSRREIQDTGLHNQKGRL